MRPLDNTEMTRLMTQPFVGAAAFSAYGVGLAAQGFGMWLGAVATSMEAMQRLAQGHAPAGGTAADEASLPLERSAKPARQRATAAVETIMADAVAVAHDVVEIATPVALMPEDWLRPAATKKPAKPDDLKLIAGIGPKLEKVLNGLGVWTFSQIAAWSEPQIAWVDDYLSFKGRIDRDGWIEQARRLVGDK